MAAHHPEHSRTHPNWVQARCRQDLGVPTKSQHRPDYQPLPELLRELRGTADLTQRELAEQLGRPYSFVEKCESGERRMDVTEFLRWCRACRAEPLKAFGALIRRIEKG